MTQISLAELHKHLLIAISPVLVQTVNLSGKEKVGPKSDSDLLFQIPLVGFYFNLHFLSLYVIGKFTKQTLSTLGKKYHLYSFLHFLLFLTFVLSRHSWKVTDRHTDRNC